MSPALQTQRLRDTLSQMLMVLDRIAGYTEDLDKTRFLQDQLRIDGVLLNLLTLGEASRRILRDHPEFASAQPTLALTSAYQLRNALVHGYDKVDLNIIWGTVCNDLPAFRHAVLAALDTLSPG